MKAACVCWTPYQLINAINFVENNIEATSGVTDLYIMNSSKLTSLYPNIINSRIFNNVYIFDDYSKKHPNITRLKKGIDMLFPSYAVRRLTHEYCEDYKSYKLVIASGWHLFFIELLNCNDGCKVIFTEDGLGSYYGDMRNYELSARYKLFNKLFHRGALSVNVDTLYLNRLEMANKNIPMKTKQMPQIKDYCLNSIKEIFNYDSSHALKYKGKKIIYFTQPYEMEKDYIKFDFNRLYRIFSQYSEYVIVRNHPFVTHIPSPLDKFEIDKGEDSWELISRDVVCNDTTLVGVLSTAQFTPQILYHLKPTIIFLYKLIFQKESEIRKSADEILNTLKPHYCGNIYIPETDEELYYILKVVT